MVSMFHRVSVNGTFKQTPTTGGVGEWVKGERGQGKKAGHTTHAPDISPVRGTAWPVCTGTSQSWVAAPTSDRTARAHSLDPSGVRRPVVAQVRVRIGACMWQKTGQGRVPKKAKKTVLSKWPFWNPDRRYPTAIDHPRSRVSRGEYGYTNHSPLQGS